MRATCATKKSPVWRLQLSPARPGGEIVLSAKGLLQLTTLVVEANADERCRVIVLEGGDGTFCRGMDLEALIHDREAHEKAGVRQYAQCLRTLRGTEKPVIALVDGAAIAGGVGIAAAADVIIATRASQFALPEVILGLVPSMVLPMLRERMAPQKARRFALLGQSITGEEAAQLGLVDRLVDSSAALDRALRTIIRQLLRVNPSAAARLKQLCQQTSDLTLNEAIDAGASCTAALIAEKDRINQIRCFLAGEPLPWFDRYRDDRDDSEAKSK